MTSGTAYDMDRSMVVHQLFSTEPINFTFYRLTTGERSVGIVENDATRGLSINDSDLCRTLCEHTMVSFLPATFRIKVRHVEYSDV